MSFAMELYEKKILSRNDLDGIDLTWGNHQAAYELLEKIVHGRESATCWHWGQERRGEDWKRI